MKKLLIFCLLLWLSVSSFAQPAGQGAGLINGRGLYWAKNHLTNAKWIMDTASTRLLLDDTYSIAGSLNANLTTWSANTGGLAYATLTSPLTSVYTAAMAYNYGTGGAQPIGTIGFTTTRLLLSPSTVYQTSIFSNGDSITMRASGPFQKAMSLHIDSLRMLGYNTVTAFDTVGFPPTTFGWISRFSASGQNVNYGAIANQTSANTTGTTQASMNIIKLSHSTGTALNSQVVTANLYVSDNGNATTIRGFQSNIIHQGTGTLAEIEGYYDQGVVLQAAGTVTDYYGARLGASTVGPGTITRRWGVYQEDALAKNKFEGKLLVNNMYTATGNPAVVVHDTDSTFKQMTLSLPSSGSFTPALSNTTNISASVLSQATYEQVGNIVTAHVSGTLTSTDGTNVCILTIDLPVSTATTFQDGTGSGTVALWLGSHGTLIGLIPLYGLVSNGTHFQIKCFPTTTTISDFSVTIQYHTD